MDCGSEIPVGFLRGALQFQPLISITDGIIVRFCALWIAIRVESLSLSCFPLPLFTIPPPNAITLRFPPLFYLR